MKRSMISSISPSAGQLPSLVEQMQYWLTALDGAPTGLGLPTDQARPAKQDHRRAFVACHLDAKLTSALGALSRRRGTTMFVTLLAGWAALLARLSGQRDLVIATPTVSRKRIDNMADVGPQANLLALRLDLSNAPNVTEWLQRVNAQVQAARQHQDIAFEQLAQIVWPPETPVQAPLVEVVFAYRDGAPPQAAPFSANFDLSLTLTDHGDTICGALEYASALFERSTIERYHAHWCTLLQAMVNDDLQTVQELPLLDTAQRGQLLREWNATESPHPDESCIHELFEAQVAQSPHATALVHEQQQLTYAELNERSNRLAHHLRELGVQPDECVAMCVPRGLEMVVALLGILKAGAAYVPLDPQYPAQRLDFMLRDCAARVVLTLHHLRDALPHTNQQLVCLDADGPTIAGHREHNLDARTRADHLAYVMYTSGSTGTPKGVQICHRSIRRLVRNAAFMRLDETTVMLQAAPLGFDASTLEIWGPLLNGGRCVLYADPIPTGPGLAHAIRNHGVNTLWLTSALFNSVVDDDPAHLAGLSQLLTGGEALSVAHVARATWALPDTTIINGYGPTECTTFTTTYTIARPFDRSMRSVPIGRPITDTRCHVLDEHLQLVPVGVVGELYVGGEGLARDYLNSPELTAERFVADPFVAGQRLYRTGDLARYQADGNLEYVGRRDFQVKLRGFRIELGEIEAVLNACAGVKQSVVVVREDRPGQRHLVAYLVGGAPHLMEELKQRLPAYMLPAAIVQMDALPLTPNGKLDRKALPTPQFDAPESAYVSPRSQIEETLVQIWRDVLSLQRVGIHDDFFDLGGHSLLAAQAISRVRREFARDVPLRLLFDAPTIAEFAARLEPSSVVERVGASADPDGNARRRLIELLRQKQAARATGDAIPRRSESGPTSLSFAQESLWFLDQLTGPSGVYNVSHAVRLRGTLDVTTLERSLHALIARHESLRTAFELRGGAPLQVVQPVGKKLDAATLEPLQMAGETDDEREQALPGLLRASIAEPFDLSRAPLLRAQLLRLTETEHVLLLVVHHIVTDGWSMGVLTRELSMIYSSSGDAGCLAPLPVQFADYAVWQRKQLAAGRFDKQLHYWREHLAGLEALELPTDRPRPVRASYRGAVEHFQLPGAVLEQLKALAGRETATLFMVLLAAFQVLLMRYSRQRDLAVGFPVAGRTRTEFEGLIGYFVNTLVLRTDLSGNPGFVELLQRVRRTTLDAFANLDLPFDRLVAELSPQRDPSRNPLYQVAFSLNSQPAAELRMTGLRAEHVEAHSQTCKFDLAVWLTESEGSLHGTLEYSTDLFEATTIQRMATHFQTLLAGIIADPVRPIAQLPLLGTPESQQIGAEWNDTAAPYPDDQCLHQLFEAQLLRSPDAFAGCGDRQIDYRALDAKANQLAHHLRSLGIGKGARVGLCIERSLDMLVAMLGTWKAGAAYVPLDPDHPAERLNDMAEDARLTLLIAQSSLQHALRFPREHVLLLDADAALLAGCRDDCLPRNDALDAGPDHPAYVIYTSGSTGKPKGVEVQHRAAVNFLHSMGREPGLLASDRFVAITTLSFDIALFELLLPLTVGASLHIATREQSLDGKALAQLLDQARATAMFATPARWRMLIDAGWQGSPSFKGMVGGEALPLDLAEQLLERCGGELWNMYGPTETTVASTCWRVEQPARGICIGRPIANTTVRVLDEHGQPCPIGVPGEIYIGGVGVALGYLDRPELTAERFVPDVFSSLPGARLYRTGDQGRWRNDGMLEHLGRLDFQVKIRGFRIELGEIEAQLAAHPNVARTTVIAREDRPGDRRLVAYVVLRAGMPAAGELREHLRVQLPEYMVPHHFVALEAIPLLLNGKIDRQALPAPEIDTESAAYVAPRSPAEEVLVAIWSEVLGATRVGVHDNFFDLGGHSLMANAAMSRIRAVFDGEPPLRLMFEAPTVAQMVARLPPLAPWEDGESTVTAIAGRSALPLIPSVAVDDDARNDADGARRRLLDLRLRSRQPAMRDAIPRRSASIAPPLSFAQEGLWFLDQLTGASEVYNISHAVRLSGALDAGALKRSLHALIERHESLRTAFEQQDDATVQVVWPVATVVDTLSLEPVEVCGNTLSQREQALAGLLREGVAQPFDLSRAPLMRAQLLRLAQTEHVLLIVVHHIVSDGWSMGVMARELGALYAAHRVGVSLPLLPLPIQFADYAVWQRERLQGARLEDHLRYWRQQLEGLKPLELPSDQPRTAQMSHRGNVERRNVPVEVLDGLKVVARRKKATLFMVLLAAFKVLLMRYCGQDDVAVGTPIAGRDRPELEGLIGYLVNSVVMRTDLSGNPGFDELLDRVRHTALDAYAHQELPFDRLVAELSPRRDLNRNPLFDVLINQFDLQSVSSEFSELVADDVRSQELSAKFAVTLYIDTRADHAALILVFRRDLFSQAWGSHCVDQFVALLGQIVDEPTAPIQTYSLLTDRSRPWLPDPTSEIAEPAQVPVAQRVLDWAQSAPQKIAVRSGSREWSYGDLADRASALAAALQAHGVGSGDVVAILGSKSFGVVGSMLGTLLSGAAFLTIDPALPRDRQRLMLREARARMLCVLGNAQPDMEEMGHGDACIVVRLDADLDDVESLGDEALKLPRVVGDDPAYVFFTSGSTGRPKAVLGCHKGLSQFVRWQQEAFDIGPDDRVSQLTALSFDPLLRDVFLPLTSGAMLCIPREQDAFDTPRWLHSERITVVHTTPALLQSWLADVDGEAALPHLRWLFLSGEALMDALVTKWRHRFATNGRLVNLYGPTETTMARCSYIVPEELEHGIQPVGTPIDHTQALVMSAAGRLCGVNEPGEIVLRTPFRSLGYFNLPDENRARFRPNPFRDDAGDLLYFTGDRGRFRADGLLEIAGRLDDQVKIRGVRVEPGEVTAVLARHEAVRDCVVIARKNAADDYELIGYVVKASDLPLDVRELREYLKGQLPAAFVPNLYVLLDALPLLPNGKVDRKALPEPEREVFNDSYVAPRTAIEEALADIWSNLLGVTRVGVHDDFFELGGHSLLATRTVSRIRTILQVELAVRTLFEAPTIARLAQDIARRRSDAQHSVAVASSSSETDAQRQALVHLRLPQRPSLAVADSIARRPESATIPLSFSQEGLWFLDQLTGPSGVYNIARAVRLQGRLDVDALDRSVRALVERHETLRTAFEQRDGSGVQVVLPVSQAAAGLRLEPLPIGGASAAEREQVLGETLRTGAAEPFDLSQAPLLRLKLLRMDEDDHVLLLVIHHIVSDGWSVGVLTRELGALYASAVGSRPLAPLPPLPIQFADYALWQRQRLAADMADQQLDYWRKQLQGLETLDLPADRPRPVRASYRGAVERFVLPKALHDQLNALARRENATLFMVLLASFQVLLMRHSRQRDFAVGVPVASRDRTEVEGLIGFFVNTVVLRADLAHNPSFTDLLGQVRQTALDAFANHELPFDRLVAELSPQRDLSRNPLYQVAFALQSHPDNALDLKGLEARPIDLQATNAKFDLSLSLAQTEDALHGACAYATDLFDPVTIQALLTQFQTLLESIVAEPATPVASLELLGPSERARLMATVNPTAYATPRDATIHALLEQQSQRTPAAVALVHDGRQLSYQQLDRRSNQLARHLRARGVGRHALVGLAVERSVAMVVAQIAILKAGAAYVPLDPAYPAERLAFMAADAQLALLVTESSSIQALERERCVLLDVDAAAIAEQPDAPLGADADLDAQADDPAYVIYTSGSTGRPKGVVVPHRAVVNFLASMAREPGLTAADRLVAVTTLSFDIAVLELLLPLTVGAEIVLASREQSLNGQALRQLLEASGASIMQATPVTWRMLIDAGWRGSSTFKGLIGGERLPEDLASQLLEHTGTLWNMYGPTETTVWSTCWKVEQPEHGISIGRPIANTVVRVLDEQGQPCPIGVPGEIYIGGDGVALGYLRRPELNAERFIADPFGVAGARLYRTGDLGRWRHDGVLEHRGRLDFQVKVRGHRIELGEIETQLALHAQVARSIVVVREDRAGDARLVAYVVSRSAMPSVNELRAHLRSSLPDYMVPQHFVQLAAIPLLPNGKTDRHSLPPPDTSAVRQDDKRSLRPSTADEIALATIWTELLGVSDIRATDNFFDLGGHSLLAMRAIAEMEKRTGHRIHPRRLIGETLEQVARRQDTEQVIQRSMWARLKSLIGGALKS
jgi:amino acid adenylation domain-containing protein